MMRGIIVGAGGQGKVVLDILEQCGNIRVEGFINIYGNERQNFLGYPILGYPDALDVLKAVECVFFAVGDNYLRGQWVECIKDAYPHLSYPSVIHPRSMIATSCELTEGCVIGAGAVVQPGASVGAFCLMNTLAVLEHDSRMERLSSLGPHSCTGGGVSIGKYTAIGLQATVLQRIRVGEHSVVGAGSVVTRDIDDYTVAYGVPAKKIRKRMIGEAYL